MGIFNRFFKTPNSTVPISNVPNPNTTSSSVPANVGPNSNLEKNVRAYVNGYIRNRNTNKLPNLNKAMVLALHKYVNFKRPRAAGTVAGVLGNAKAPEKVQLAGGLAAGNVPLTATPAAAGSQVGNNVKTAGGNATQVAAAAAAAAKQQAVSQGKPANVATQAGATAAARMANANTQTPVAASNAARNGAAAAGLPENASRAAGLMAQASQPEPANQPVANNRKNMLKTLTNLTTNAIVNARIKEIRGKNPNAKWNNVNANGLTNGQKKVLNGLKMGKNYTGIVRQKTPNANNISQEN